MPLDPDLPDPLLGGLSPNAFMRRHWQKKPLVVRQALPGGVAWADRTRLFALAARDEVESRLVLRDRDRWTLRPGPIGRASRPPARQPGWTLLVQGVDLHWPEARGLLDRFRFVPDARLDDLMISYATDGGGVGPHVDAYDVFLLQAHGRRRWRVGRVRTPVRFVPDTPLKRLADFEPAHDWLLETGDLLYLPPGWGHDGVAEGACATCSIGFRAPARDELAGALLQRVADAADADDAEGGLLYADPSEPATGAPGRIPAALRSFAGSAVEQLLRDPAALDRALGEWLSEPKPTVSFEAGTSPAGPVAVVLDRRSKMLYDAAHVYLNGEAFRSGGRDATLMHRLADARRLAAAEVRRLSPEARRLLNEWIDAGWLHAVEAGNAFAAHDDERLTGS